jgi:ubiquitin carboxyl-terminal hydrolase 5/13
MFCSLTHATFTSLFLSHTHTQGSGGTNGALDHYHETGQQYPLVVKLGTITSDINTADCYSYAADEDGPVKIPNLMELLQKRGINVTSMYVRRKRNLSEQKFT